MLIKVRREIQKVIELRRLSQECLATSLTSFLSVERETGQHVLLSCSRRLPKRKRIDDVCLAFPRRKRRKTGDYVSHLLPKSRDRERI